jgi:hypothetical protein
MLLHPQGNASPGWLLMDIERGVMIRRSHWRKEPIPPQAIEAIERIAEADQASRKVSRPEPIDDVPGVVAAAGAKADDEAGRLPRPETVRGRAPDLEHRPDAVAVELDNSPVDEPVTQPVVAVEMQPPQVVDIVREAEESLLDGSAGGSTRTSSRIAGRRVDVYSLESRFEEIERTRRRHINVVDRVALHMYAREAQRKHGDAAIVSAENEIREMLERSVFNFKSRVE